MTVSEEQRSADTPQRLFRKVNERIRHLNEPFSSSVKASWSCECANGECFERVEMLLADYEDMQRHPSTSSSPTWTWPSSTGSIAPAGLTVPTSASGGESGR
jgi:hypothetical protein